MWLMCFPLVFFKHQKTITKNRLINFSRNVHFLVSAWFISTNTITNISEDFLFTCAQNLCVYIWADKKKSLSYLTRWVVDYKMKFLLVVLFLVLLAITQISGEYELLITILVTFNNHCYIAYNVNKYKCKFF